MSELLYSQQRISVIKNTGVLAAASIISSIIGVVAGLFQARFVPPVDLGLFKTFGIATTYLSLLHLGLFDALQRELPFLLAYGDKAEAQRRAGVGLAWIRIAGAIAGACFLGLALWGASSGNWAAFAGWLTQIPIIIFVLYGGFLATLYRTGQDFKRLSYANISGSIAGLLLLPIILLMPYLGLCIKTAGATSVNTVFLHRFRPLKLAPQFNRQTLRDMLRIGTPLFIGGYIGSSLWLATEAALALGLYGRRALGLLAVAIMLREAVAVLATSLNQVYMPQLAAEYGRTNSCRACLRIAFRPCATSFLINSILAVIGIVLLKRAVSFLTPMYMEAVPAMVFALLIAPVKALELPLYIFKAAGNAKGYIIMIMSGFVAFLFMVLVFKHFGAGFQSIALSFLVGKIVSVLVGFLFLGRLYSSGP